MRKAYMAAFAAIGTGFVRKTLNKVMPGRRRGKVLKLVRRMCPRGCGSQGTCLCYRDNMWWSRTENDCERIWRRIASMYPDVAADMQIHYDCACPTQLIKDTFPMNMAVELIKCSGNF